MQVLRQIGIIPKCKIPDAFNENMLSEPSDVANESISRIIRHCHGATRVLPLPICPFKLTSLAQSFPSFWLRQRSTDHTPFFKLSRWSEWQQSQCEKCIDTPALRCTWRSVPHSEPSSSTRKETNWNVT